MSEKTEVAKRPDGGSCDHRATAILNKWLTEDIGFGSAKSALEKAGMKGLPLQLRLVIYIREALESGYKETRNLGAYKGDTHSGVFATDEEMKGLHEIGMKFRSDSRKAWPAIDQYCQDIASRHGLDPSVDWAPNTEGEFLVVQRNRMRRP